jgi:hypothetical protein
VIIYRINKTLIFVPDANPTEAKKKHRYAVGWAGRGCSFSFFFESVNKTISLVSIGTEIVTGELR